MKRSSRLKIERERRGWSQARIAKSLNVTTRTVSRWELGEATPYPYHRKLLVGLFEKSALELGLITRTNESEMQGLVAPQEDASPSSPPAPSLFDPAIPEAPGDANSLLGRDALLARIKQRLLESKSLTLTALNGLPGIGKTALAVALASDPQMQEQYCDGILWAGLGTHPNVLSLLTRWGNLLGIRVEDVEDANSRDAWQRALSATIGSRRMLLVIDDAWSPEDALAFRVGGSNCAYVLTTRLPQVAFAFAQHEMIVVPELEEADGLALLARFVPQFVAQDEEAARDLLRVVGYLPLAVKLMGYYLAAQALSGQPRRLQAAITSLRDAQRRLEVSMPSGWQKQWPGSSQSVSLQAVIAVSEQRLSGPAQTMLRALTAFPARPNSFSEEAAFAIGQEPVETLDELWDIGLLEASGPGRYMLHQTIFDYIRLQVEDRGQIQQRLVRYMLAQVKEHERDYEMLEVELANIVEALDDAIKLELRQELGQMVLAMLPFMRTRGLYLNADTYLQHAQKAAEALGDHAKNVLFLSHLGAFAALRGDNAQAERYGQQGLALARQHGLEEMISALLETSGRVAFSRGNFVQARLFYTEALQMARQYNDTERITTLLCHLGDAIHAQGDYQQAEDFLREGLLFARQYDYQALKSRLLASLGQVTYRAARPELAIEYFQEGLALAQKLGHRQLTSLLLTHLGTTYMFQARIPLARVHFQEALVLSRQIGHREQICGLLLNLATISGLVEADYPQTKRYLQEGIELARQAELYDRLSMLLSVFGLSAGFAGDPEQANLYCAEGLELARREGSPYTLGWSLTNWAEVHVKFGQFDAAAAACEETLALSEKANMGTDMQIVAKAQFLLAKILALRGQVAQARELGNKAIAILEQMKHIRLIEVKTWMAQLPESDETSPAG